MLSRLKKIGIAVCLLSGYHAQAQDIEPVVLKLPTTKVENSLYNKITVVDTRPDTTSLGIVQTGMFNKQVKAVAGQPLILQFNNILSALNGGSAQPGELLLLLRQLNFSEMTTTYSEKGFFGFGATLYVKKDSVYAPLGSIDTLAIISAMDVTNKNVRNGSSIITNFLAQNLTKTPIDATTYKYEELLNYEKIAKKNIKLYNTDTYANGYYTTYQSFGNQTPDGQIVLDDKNGEIKPGNIKMVTENGSFKKIKTGAIYAFVLEGKPYISTPFGYYLITKSDNDFFFTGKLSNTISNNNAIVMGVMFGAIGGAIAGATATNKDLPYDVKILYSTGDFIRLRQSK